MGDGVGEGELAVGVAGDLPWSVVDEAVMVCAQKNEVATIGASTTGPWLDVVDLPELMGCVAAWESAVDVAMSNRFVKRG